MEQNLTFYPGGDRFNVRTAAVLLWQDRVLLSRDVPDAGYRFLPGGRVQLHEPAEETIRRELCEELGISCAAPRLLWVVENFFTSTFYRRRTHEICFFYLVQAELPDWLTAHSTGEFLLHDDADRINIPFEWVPLETLGESRLEPAFLRTRLQQPLPTRPEILTVIDDKEGNQ
jgi:ADP-ribose pyrophosphatase YjhB (NUDIX family)